MNTQTHLAEIATSATPAERRAAAMRLLRRLFPSLRRTAATAIVHSGGTVTVYGCLCGGTHTTGSDVGHMSQARARRHVTDWLTVHATCAVELAQQAARGELELVRESRTFGRGGRCVYPVLRQRAQVEAEVGQ